MPRPYTPKRPKSCEICGGDGPLTKHKSVEENEKSMVWKCRTCLIGDDSDLRLENFIVQAGALADYERMPSNDGGNVGDSSEFAIGLERKLIALGKPKMKPLFKHMCAPAGAPAEADIEK